MSWFSSLIGKLFGSQNNVGRYILELGKKMLVTFVGRVANDLQSIAVEEVLRAEASGLDGDAKRKMAFDGIKARLKTSVKNHLIGLSIENALAAIIANQKKP